MGNKSTTNTPKKWINTIKYPNLEHFDIFIHFGIDTNLRLHNSVNNWLPSVT